MLDLPSDGKIWADDAYLIIEHVGGSYTVLGPEPVGEYDRLAKELKKAIEQPDVVRAFTVVGETPAHFRTAQKPKGE